jgi:hypothetical protein
MTNLATAFGVNSVFKRKMFADWSVEYMNPDITSSWTLLDVSRAKQKLIRRYN